MLYNKRKSIFTSTLLSLIINITILFLIKLPVVELKIKEKEVYNVKTKFVNLQKRKTSKKVVRKAEKKKKLETKKSETKVEIKKVKKLELKGKKIILNKKAPKINLNRIVPKIRDEKYTIAAKTEIKHEYGIDKKKEEFKAKKVEIDTDLDKEIDENREIEIPIEIEEDVEFGEEIVPEIGEKMAKGINNVEVPSWINDLVLEGGGEVNFLKGQNPKYPLKGEELGREGTVKIKLKISEDGNVISSLIVQKSGFSEFEAAVERVKNSWKFAIVKNGKKIAGTVVVTINFKIGEI